MKKYKAIFFDWDGTAVLSRTASVNHLINPMKLLLSKGIKLAVISGTTIENIGRGELHTFFTKEERENLFFGLGRGAFNSSFDQEGNLCMLKDSLPEKNKLLCIHDICYEIHRELLDNYGLKTDIVFSRPNYCKIDLVVESDRGQSLFLQEGEKERLLELLKQHGFSGGLKGLMQLAEQIGRKYGLSVLATTDAKYLEVGITSKSHNVDFLSEYFQEKFGILPEECAFWGDEYIGFGEGIYGSDSFMITETTRKGDFFDVSESTGERPKEVQQVGGGVENFLKFLEEQGKMVESQKY